MKSTQMLPTKENIYESIQQDIIGRNKQVYYFASTLNDVEGPYTFAVNARWGDGKTFFVKQTQMLLDACNPITNSLSNAEKSDVKAAIQHAVRDDNACVYLQPQMTVYYDAWACDNDTDPIISLVCEITKQSAIYFKHESEDDKKKFVKLLSLCSGLADLIPGINTSGLAAAIKDLAEKPNALDQINQQRDLQNAIANYFAELPIEQGNRLVVFVDELDRCKPDFAVRFLERIKHYFVLDNVTFVFSVNISELRHTINRFYGDGFSATLYLTRFFDCIIDLPEAELRDYYASVGLNTSNHFEIVCKAVIKHFNFSLRDLAQFYKRCRLAAYKKTHNSSSAFGDGAEIGLTALIPIMIGLGIHDYSKYQNFINGKDPTTLIDILGNGDFLAYFFHELLSGDETYDQSDTNKKHVTREQKLKEYYNAIFVEDYSKGNYFSNIGSVECNNEAKSYLLQAASGLTSFADRT